jgi:four helix bundle suffix protein
VIDAKRKKLRPSGGYRDLRSFRIATIIYDATYWFCERFIDRSSRTIDQMVQAARSGRQNIAEGSRAAATSSQTELRLVNVARASLEELLLDYEDFLRHRRLPLWAPDSVEALAVRRVGRQATRVGAEDQSNRTDRSDESDEASYARYAQWLDHRDAAVRANAIICLIHQANYLLDQQIAALENDFIQQGGYSEQLAVARIVHRNTSKAGEAAKKAGLSDPPGPNDPIPFCPACGSAMVLRTAKQGKNAGTQFWGCAAYPDCKGIVKI